MIYICVPTSNHAATVGLVLWKIRQVFMAFPREYHLLVADDGSTDATAEVLETYQRVLPMSVMGHASRQGYGATLEALLREAMRRTDRPRRDVAVTMGADFRVSPQAVPELIKRTESGADLVVGEAIEGDKSVLGRTVRRAATRLLQPGLQVPGVADVLSDFAALRLSTLRRCLRERPERLLETDGPLAHAELVARTATHARQIAVVDVPREYVHPRPAATGRPLALAVALFQTGRRLRVPRPAATVERGS